MKLIPLTQGQSAVVDDDWYPYLLQWEWYARPARSKTKTYYAVRMEKRKPIAMHRVVIGATPGQIVDHLDRNGLNNISVNLRLSTHPQNCCNRDKQENNTSGFKGVSWHKKTGKWRAEIMSHGKRIHLGYFHDPEGAAQAYNAAARLHHGDFAVLNARAREATK